MAVLRPEVITRAMVQANPQTLFVFGDNMDRSGRGGQAREMRGEPNAVGVPTKWYPGRDSKAYFSDEDLRNWKVWKAVHEAFEKMRAALKEGRDVVIPADGLGTGLADLPTRAPKFHAALEAAIASLEEQLTR